MTNQTPPIIFNRALLAKRRDRARHKFAQADFLHRFVAEDIVDRLEMIQRDFPTALAMGPGGQLIREMKTPASGLQEIEIIDPLLQPAPYPMEGFPPPPRQNLSLVISMMDLHTINDPLGAIVTMRHCLQADGLFIAAMPSENTLKELRDCLYTAESELLGGVTPRIIPFGAVKDLGGLLQRAGYALPVADVLRIPVTYRNPMRLLQDLRYMGETAALMGKSAPLRRKVLAHAMELYQSRYSVEKGVIATFEIVILTGWAPHSSQQQALKPGSGKTSLEAAIKNS